MLAAIGARILRHFFDFSNRSLPSHAFLPVFSSLFFQLSSQNHRYSSPAEWKCLGKKNFLPCHGSVHPASTVVSSHRPFITVTWTTRFASRKKMSNPDCFIVAAQVGKNTNGSISGSHPRIPMARKALHVFRADLKFDRRLSRSDLSRLIDLTLGSDVALATK